MKLEVIRFNKGEDSTNGILFDVTNERKFLCYTLEDESRKEKVYGETCIPEGEYCINFRAEGGYHAKYSKRFADILIHCGNTDEDTAGCLLVGDTQENNNIKKNGFIGRSTAAYTRIYPDIADALSRGEEVTIEYRDFSTALILDPLSL